MKSHRRIFELVLLFVLASTIAATAESKKEFRFTVKRHASISIVNQYGPISAKPAAGNQVVVIAILHSDKVEIDSNQGGNHVSLVSHLLQGADADSGRVDYEVLVPADANVSMHSATGLLRAEKLHGDLILEGNTANVDVRDMSDGHVHVKTLDGPVSLSNVSDGHVEITSVSGDVVLTSVNGPLVYVNSASGKIHYDGDFGEGGEYSLMTHTGDIEATAPAFASIDVVARSTQGRVENDFTLQPSHTSFPSKLGSAFSGTMGKAASSVKLFSFSGRIHLKKRTQ